MKILVCGGAKTNKVVVALENRFRSGVSFCVEEQIENIDNLIMRGETFDRAIIFEQAITNDGMNNESYKLRKNLTNFVSKIKSNFTKYELVFITETRDRARLIIEETIDVAYVSVVIVKSPPYATSFITQLVSVELRNFDKGLIFSQDDVRKMIESESEDENILWSDEVEKTKGEILQYTEFSNENIIKQLENFVFTFTRTGIKVSDIREEVNSTKFSDEIKEVRVGNKSKVIARKG